MAGKEKQVKIALTEVQKSQIKKATGMNLDSLTYDALEDRVAPVLLRVPSSKLPVRKDPE